MKKGITLAFLLGLIFILAACGTKDSDSSAGSAEQSSEKTQIQAEPGKRVADKYHELLEGKNTAYYYEAKVSEYQDVNTEPMTSVRKEGRNQDGIFVISTQPNLREIETKDAYYTVDDSHRQYTKDELEVYEDEIALQYVQTSKMELDGKIWTYDEYQDEYELEGFGEDGETVEMATYLYKKRYLVDEKGELYAIVILQEQKGESGTENLLIYKEVDTITKLEDKNVPEAFFEIPDDYREVEMLDE